jgi:hypothetical protein
MWVACCDCRLQLYYDTYLPVVFLVCHICILVKGSLDALRAMFDLDNEIKKLDVN